MQFLITAIVVVNLLVGVVSSCPSVCSCSDHSFGFYVNCNNRGLDSIPTDLPNNTNSLQLFHNNITVIQDSSFNNLPNLENLHLQNNDISVIENNAFNNVPRLYSLQLHHNNITVIQNSTFNNLPNLGYLDLNSNKITSIQSSTFNDLPNLYNLQLQNNEISVIENSTFNNLSNLEYLYLYSNKITSIQSSTFNDLPNLYNLQLQNNDISVIEDNAFNNVPRLQSLYLYSNKITSIQSSAFNDLPNLYNLLLHNNDISVIEENAFNNLTNLVSLIMNNNPISLVSEHALENLPQLSTLKLDMYCRGCGNIPFWRWLRRNHKFSTSTTCNDYDGMHLYYLQPNNVTDCFDCSTGTYGVSCEARCDTCVNRMCDIFDGKCTYGCIEGFNGDRCSLTGLEIAKVSSEAVYRGRTNNTMDKLKKTKATSKSATSYTAVYTGVGSFVVTALICVIIVLVILRYRRTKTNVHELERKGQKIKEYQIGTFSDDSANIGAHYEETVITEEDQLYESIGQ